MYLFFPTFRLNLVFAVNCFSFLSQIEDDAKVDFTALKGSLGPADNGIPVHLLVLTLKLTGCSKFFYDECLWAGKQKKFENTSSKGKITSQMPPLHLQCSVAVEKMFSKWAG